jgi:methylthioribose-1-phosphate isomerase
MMALMSSSPWDPMEPLSGTSYSAAELAPDDARIYVLDQRRLPTVEVYLERTDVAGAATSIRDMEVRGAPAIGITAAYGMTLAAHANVEADATGYLSAMRSAGELLEATRPTAVNLSWAVNRCLELATAHASEPGEARWHAQADHARAIHRDDVASCRAMGAIGATHVMSHTTRKRADGKLSMLTHCNAGALATGGYGTALGVLRALAAQVVGGGGLRVFAGETRPYLQGARLTAWELHKDDIDVTVVSDNMVAHCMQQGMIDAVVVGADRISANGDVANKIGTYGIACLARHHGIPFYVAAPWSTVDLATADGASIVIEQRAARELTHLGEIQLVPDGAGVYNPAFDATPAELIDAIFTETGAYPPARLRSAAESSAEHHAAQAASKHHAAEGARK